MIMLYEEYEDMQRLKELYKQLSEEEDEDTIAEIQHEIDMLEGG